MASLLLTISKFACAVRELNPHSTVALSISLVHTICSPFARPHLSASSSPPFVQSAQLHDSPMSHVLLLLQMTVPHVAPDDLQVLSEEHQYSHSEQVIFTSTQSFATVSHSFPSGQQAPT